MGPLGFRAELRPRGARSAALVQPGSRTEAPPERAGFRLASRWPSKPKEVPKAAAPKAAAPKPAAPKPAAPKVAGKAEHHHAGAAGAPKAAVPKAAGKEAPTAEAKEGKGAGGAKEAKAGGQGGAAASKEAALSARTNPMRRDR